MTRWISVAAALSVCLAGCNKGPRTIATARPVEEKQPGGELVTIAEVKAPEKSDPKAAALIAEAIAAHTGGNPALLQKLISVRYSRAGKVHLGTGPTNQEWTVDAVWPDHFRVDIRMPENRILLVVNGDEEWLSRSGGPREPIPSPMNGDIRNDFTGDWLQLLFPLSQPELIAAPAETVTVGGKSATGVRVWHPKLSDAILYFDSETKLLTRLTYVGQENGAKAIKDIVVLSNKDFAGVKLPERTVLKRPNGTEFAEWTTVTVEPQVKIDPKLFEAP